jgi:Rrf2 family protein
LFSQSVEYSLRTVVWLATQGGEPRTTRQIAEATKVPQGYLSKILQKLGRGGLVTARRGMNGGFTLRVSPDDLSPLDVINVIDPIKRVKKCPLGMAAHKKSLCPLHQRLDDAIGRIEKELSDTKISELLDTESTNRPFCD